ncbi:hypothetical protein THAOC_01492, partial [Thalassiosira oceanica]
MPPGAYTMASAHLPFVSNSAEGLVNLALHGTATQSATEFDGEASRAIDGNTNGDY